MYTFVSRLFLFSRFFFLVHGVDRPPNARVIRTDIRTIKEFLMVRIWSRWAADVRRQSRSYRYFVPRARIVVYDRTKFLRALTIVEIILPRTRSSSSLSSSLIFASYRRRWHATVERRSVSNDLRSVIYLEYIRRERTKLVVLQKTAYKTFTIKKLLDWKDYVSRVLSSAVASYVYTKRRALPSADEQKPLTVKKKYRAGSNLQSLSTIKRICR